MCHKGHIWIACMLLDIWLTACMPCISNEAQSVVAHADSLRAEGRMYDDSVRLANACQTLHAWRMIYPDEYAHCCYHYGRLLRAKDDPVSAMEVFINAAHSRTHDRHILGRVYSNMGSLCHLASEYPLSYDMYERSADCFLQNGDSINYYYALNDMAFEKALLAEKDSCFDILFRMESTDVLKELEAYCCITKAEVYKRHQEYDSTIYYAHRASLCMADEAAVALLLAQAFSYMGIKDSAVYYAEHVLTLSPTLDEQNNALYILANDNEEIDKNAIRKVAATRADVQKILEIRQGKLSQAVQLLEQNLNKQLDLRWLYAIITTIVVVSIVILSYRRHQKKRHALLSQKMEDLTTAYSDLQLTKTTQIEQTCAIMCTSEELCKELNWKDYELMCKEIDKHFYLLASKLKKMQVLNEQEVRLCILTLLNLSRTQIADILPYAQNGIGKLKYRIAQKLGIEGKNLRKFLICMAVDEPQNAL